METLPSFCAMPRSCSLTRKTRKNSVLSGTGGRFETLSKVPSLLQSLMSARASESGSRRNTLRKLLLYRITSTTMSGVSRRATPILTSRALICPGQTITTQPHYQRFYSSQPIKVFRHEQPLGKHMHKSHRLVCFKALVSLSNNKCTQQMEHYRYQANNT